MKSSEYIFSEYREFFEEKNVKDALIKYSTAIVRISEFRWLEINFLLEKG